MLERSVLRGLSSALPVVLRDFDVAVVIRACVRTYHHRNGGGCRELVGGTIELLIRGLDASGTFKGVLNALPLDRVFLVVLRQSLSALSDLFCRSATASLRPLTHRNTAMKHRSHGLLQQLGGAPTGPSDALQTDEIAP